MILSMWDDLIGFQLKIYSSTFFELLRFIYVVYKMMFGFLFDGNNSYVRSALVPANVTIIVNTTFFERMTNHSATTRTRPSKSISHGLYKTEKINYFIHAIQLINRLNLPNKLCLVDDAETVGEFDTSNVFSHT